MPTFGLIGGGMRYGQLRALVAVVILAGHFAVFAFGLFLGIFGPLNRTDTLQTLLMASPVLTVVAASALNYTLQADGGSRQGRKARSLFAFVVIFFPIALIA